jgi:Xaa-Pro dipeptidase
MSLSIAHSLSRQSRLRGCLASLDLHAALLTRPEHVQYLSAFRPHPLQSAAVLLTHDRCLLFAPNQIPDLHAASDVIPFEAQWLCTLRQDQEHAIAAALKKTGFLPSRLGFEASRSSPALLHALGLAGPDRLIDIEPALHRLRRRKDPDELTLLRRAIAATDAMYSRAREIIAPGITELAVYNELQAAAVHSLGEPPTATGNDYQCASPGGTPRDRPAQAGELFILDLGPAFRGYSADNCRTFAVDRHPSDAQLAAHAAVTQVLEEIPRLVRPGVRCQDVFARCKALLDAHLPGCFTHHLGHGIGLYPHEAPHLNPAWDDTFEEGDVFTAEPGLYHESLRAGLRVEEDYLVTAAGIEKLTSTPTHL